jgi:hypothetical protein
MRAMAPAIRGYIGECLAPIVDRLAVLERRGGGQQRNAQPAHLVEGLGELYQQIDEHLFRNRLPMTMTTTALSAGSTRTVPASLPSCVGVSRVAFGNCPHART